MEGELRSLRQSTQSHERTIQGLTESISTKDSEVRGRAAGVCVLGVGRVC